MNTRRTSSPPIAGRTWGIAAVTGVGAFMAMLDSTVVNLALESIRGDLLSTLPLVQWVSTGYLCALAASLPAAAWLGARYGYGRVWAASLAAFVAASVLCAIAPGPVSLIGARILQGLAGGLMLPAGQAVIGSIVDKRQLGRVFGLIGFAVALGPAVGPAMGGLLLDLASWRWLFWINVPLGVAALLASRGLVPSGTRDTSRTLDMKGWALLGVGLPLLLYGAAGIGMTDTMTVAILALALGVSLTSMFVLTALRNSNPLIDLRLLGRKRFSAATVTAGLAGANMYGGLLLVPLYLQLVAGQGLADTGLWLLVMGLGSAVALPVAGALTDRYGAGNVAMGGAGLLLFGTLPFLFANPASPVVLSVALVARGVGMALAQMPAMIAAYAAVHGKEMGDASTIVNIVQRIGGAVGAVSVVVILYHANDGSSAEAYFWAFALLAVYALLSLAGATILRLQPDA